MESWAGSRGEIGEVAKEGKATECLVSELGRQVRMGSGSLLVSVPAQFQALSPDT